MIGLNATYTIDRLNVKRLSNKCQSYCIRSTPVSLARRCKFESFSEQKIFSLSRFREIFQNIIKCFNKTLLDVSQKCDIFVKYSFHISFYSACCVSFYSAWWCINSLKGKNGNSLTLVLSLYIEGTCFILQTI